MLLSAPLDLLTPPELLKGRRPVCHLRSAGSASEILLWKMSSGGLSSSVPKTTGILKRPAMSATLPGWEGPDSNRETGLWAEHTKHSDSWCRVSTRGDPDPDQNMGDRA